MKKVTLAISGASGVILSFNLLEQLLKQNCYVNLVITQAGYLTIKQELQLSLSINPNKTRDIILDKLNLVQNNLSVYSINDWYAPIASGSSVDEVMIVCPCSMATLAKIALGIGDDLLSRAADVIIKERKNLIIVPRETPFSAIHLDNMHKLALLGAAIIPPVPAFYNHPKSIDDIINSIISRILDQAAIANNLTKRW